MKILSRFWLILSLILFVMGATTAQSNVALVKVLKGEVKLDGKSYRSGFLAADGQVLELPQGARVSIKLLRNSAEMEMAGPKTYQIESQQLRSDARMVKRGSVSVAASLGSNSTAAGLLTRSKVSLYPQIMATELGGYRLELFENRPHSLFNGYEYRIAVKDPETGESLSYQGLLGRVESIPLRPNTVREGRPYDVVLDSVGSDTPEVHFATKVRVLTDEQAAELESVEKELQARFEETNQVVHLLNLADTYLLFNQNRKALTVLRNIDQTRLYPTLQSEIVRAIQQLNRDTNMPLDASASVRDEPK